MTKWLLFYKCRFCGRTFSDPVSDEGALNDDHMLVILEQWARKDSPILHDCGPSPEDREMMRRGVADPVGFRKAWPDE